MTATFEAGMQCHRNGQLAEAERFYRQVLEGDPKHANAMYLLGVITLQSGRTEIAVELFQRATVLNPDNAAYHSNLGEALRRLRRFPEAVDAYLVSMSLKPDLAEPAFNLGLLLREIGDDIDAAIACFEWAEAAKPGSPEIGLQLALARKERGARSRPGKRRSSESTITPSTKVFLGLAAIQRTLGNPEEAVTFCRCALQNEPSSVPTLIRLAESLEELGRTDEAIARFREALVIEPKNLEVLARLTAAAQSAYRLDEAVALLRQCLEIVNAPELRSLLLLTLPYLPGFDDKTILEEARAWEQKHAAPLMANVKPFDHDRSPDRRLRIGYTSLHFRDHVNKLFLEPLLANHDRQSFELFFYSDVRQPDDETAHIRLFADGWRDVVSLTDEAMADLIRADQIDILVDLTMHTANNRLLVFARKPAPIQLCWLAYPGTTGLSAMDYRVTDGFLDPPDADMEVYAERSLRLPDTFWCYDPRATVPEVNQLPALTEGRITFGCLNNYCKVNGSVLELWSQILREVKRSRLMILARAGDARRNALETFARHGVEAEQIQFVDYQPRAEYLATYKSIDLCLDTFPCSGHTTSLDAFWMGVPVVTLVGRTVIGRAGFCFAMNLGLTELIATTPGEYLRIAVELSGDLPRLSALRAGLRSQMEASPLMDGSRFARNMERQYRRIWREWCEAQPFQSGQDGLGL
jgi:predicted O-linked N-acetylglucosamine transferase (SPINDLY family)